MTDRHIQIDIQNTYLQIYMHTDIYKPNRPTYTHTYIHTDRQTDIQMYRQERQTDRSTTCIHTDRQTDYRHNKYKFYDRNLCKIHFASPIKTGN